MKKITKKIFFLSLAVLCFFYSSAPAVMAWGESINRGDVVDGMNAVLEDLGVDKNELTHHIDSFNVSRQKKQPPQVSLTFNPANPNLGEKITATAIPIYFMNDIKDMYFTWYLRTADCPAMANLPLKLDASNKNKWKKCDLDGDNKIDINDYKIKAARIIAGNDFEWDKDGDGLPDSSIYHPLRETEKSYKAVWGGDDQKNKGNNHCYIHDTESGDEYEIKCDRHLFARKPICCYPKSGCTPTVLGDEQFCSNEESVWHTDPNNSDTAGTGNGDEANLVGLGINNFIWTYQPGDQIGVAVEGISPEPTQEKDSSYKIMWALLDNKCDVDKNMNVSDIDNCLPDNFVDPANPGNSQNLSVNLSYSPENPINDTSDNEEGDQLIINSSVTEINNPAYLKYRWEVFQSDEINPDSWGDPLLKSNLPESSQTIGLGLDTFKLNLNFDKPKKYLKIKLTVTESLNNAPSNDLDKEGYNITREGHSDVVIPINSSSEQIKVYDVNVSDNASLDLSLGSNEICDDGIARSVCPVYKNEIIGLSVPQGSFSDFSWTIDGESFDYVKADVDGNLTNTAYFAVLKNVGERYTVNLTATNLDPNDKYSKSGNYGQKINLTRVFEVAEPQIKIFCADKNICVPNLLGYYLDIEGTQWPDYSQINFSALSNNPISLAAEIGNSYLSPELFSWSVDNISFTQDTAANYGFSFDNNGILTLPPKSEGESYDITAGALYTQSNLVKKALQKHWGVSYNQFYEKLVSANINVEMKFAISDMAKAPEKKILASLYSSLPSYLMFLLRIVLTAFVILVTSSLILSLSPETKNEN